MCIYKSEIFGLLGRNGAGKTTLVDIITKVTKPNQGNVIFYDKDNNEGRKGIIGICYQH